LTNWKKILGTSLLATTVTIGGVTPLFGKGHVVSAKTTQVEGLPSSPIDMHTVPEERLTKALKDQGVISQKATPQEAKESIKHLHKQKRYT